MPEATHLLTLAFGLGLLHALDADHVLAVSAATNNSNRTGTLKFCLHWALGHGVTVLLICIGVIAFGASIPAQLSQMAEAGVGLLLMLLGLWVFRQAYRNSRCPSKSSDSKSVNPVSQQNHSIDNSSPTSCCHKNSRSAPLVGILHGLAGSAGFLLLLPLGMLNTTLAVFYVILFCLGVLLAMVLFGSLLSSLWNKISRLRLNNSFRFAVATLSVAMGAYVLSSNIGVTS